MVVADLTRFLCQSPEAFRLIPGKLGRHAVFFGRPTVLLGVLTVVLGLIAKPLGLLSVLLYRSAIVRHDGSSLVLRPELIRAVPHGELLIGGTGIPERPVRYRKMALMRPTVASGLSKRRTSHPVTHRRCVSLVVRRSSDR
jgi:hypothetical protein